MTRPFINPESLARLRELGTACDEATEAYMAELRKPTPTKSKVNLLRHLLTDAVNAYHAELDVWAPVLLDIAERAMTPRYLIDAATGAVTPIPDGPPSQMSVLGIDIPQQHISAHWTARHPITERKE